MSSISSIQGREAAVATEAAAHSASNTAKPSFTALKSPPVSTRLRPIELRDREPIRDLLRRYHDRTIFGHLAFSDQKFDRLADTVYAKSPHMVCLVAEREGQILGFSCASAGSYQLSDEGIMATCHAVIVDTDRFSDTMGGKARRAVTFLRLLKGIKAWSKTRGADHLLVHITTGTVEDGFDAEATARLLRKVGGKSIGGGYIV